MDFQKTHQDLSQAEFVKLIAANVNKKNPVLRHGPNPNLHMRITAALESFRQLSEKIFYEVEEELGGYIVQGKSFPDFVSAVEYSKANRLPDGSVQSVWNWQKEPDKYTKHPKMQNLRKVIKANIQKTLDDLAIPINIITIEHDKNMAPTFDVNVITGK
tara:strand:+ start:417 stop:893 length:477 start_codon:yes stop_codon:yes gene_type:complete